MITFRDFLTRNGLIDPVSGNPLVRFCWCTDGPWDVRDFVVKQCFISKASNLITVVLVQAAHTNCHLQIDHTANLALWRCYGHPSSGRAMARETGSSQEIERSGNVISCGIIVMREILIVLYHAVVFLRSAAGHVPAYHPSTAHIRPTSV